MKTGNRNYPVSAYQTYISSICHFAIFIPTNLSFPAIPEKEKVMFLVHSRLLSDIQH